MPDSERLEMVRKFVLEEMELSMEQYERGVDTKDRKRQKRWLRRYDVLYAVWLRLND